MKSILLALTALAMAAPTPQDPPKDAPKSTHLYICTDAGFKGNCTNLEINFGECYGVGDAWHDNISSLGPDNGTFCSAFPEPNCNSAALPFTWPGIRDLTHYDFDNVISSYRCNALGGFGKKGT